MADDIVKRLRDSEWEDVLHELAADEIERLRAENAELLSGVHDEYMDAVKAAMADRDRQREARHAAECNLEAAHATVVRMREALEWLRHWRTKDHESIDCCIEHALGQAETCSVCHPHGNAALAGGAEPKYASDIEAGLREAGYGDAVPASVALPPYRALADALRDAMRHASVPDMATESGAEYPFVDLMTDEGTSIQGGEYRIALFAEYVAEAALDLLEARAADQPSGGQS